jgi:hypothetical protein
VSLEESFSQSLSCIWRRNGYANYSDSHDLNGLYCVPVRGDRPMNKSQASKWVGKEFRLRPRAIHITPFGARIPERDSRWLVRDVTDDAVTLAEVGTDMMVTLGLDNVREFRSPDYLLLRSQLTIRDGVATSEPIVLTSVDRNLTGFEALLNHGWVREFIGNREVWISEVDSMFQIEVGDRDRQFTEEWTRRFPDEFGTSAYRVVLKVQGVEIKELTFVSCDGGRIFVPMPKCGNGEGEFMYDRHSLDYKVGRIIGQFYIYESMDGVARRAGITIRSGGEA